MADVVNEEMLAQHFARVRVVLVGTLHSGNIGAAARAMKNMGFSRLYLVAPAAFPDREASYRAVQATDVLESAIVTATLEEAVGDCSLVVGTSARERRIPLPQLGPRELGALCLVERVADEVALVFGREDAGLTNDELRLCHRHVHVPTSAGYSSLNLAAAVQLLCYELRMTALELGGRPAVSGWDEPLATIEGMERFYEHLERTLTGIGFLDPAAPRQLMPRLRRMFNRVQLDQMELNILRGMLTEIDKLAAVADRQAGAGRINS